jgi:hypothetical protein
MSSSVQHKIQAYFQQHFQHEFQKYGSILAVVLFLGYLALYVMQGSHAIFTIHDNLDSEFVYRVLLAKSGQIFSWSNASTIPQVMNGLPRNAFNANALNVVSWLFVALPPIWAYLFNFVLVKIVAFLGILLVYKQLSPKEKSSEQFPSDSYAYWVAFGFVLLPQYTIYGLTVCGLPMLFYAIWQIMQGNSKAWWFYVAVFPFWSQFVLIGFVLIGGLGLIELVLVLKYRQKKLLDAKIWRFGFVFLVLLFGYAFSELNLWMLMFGGSGFVSHRTTWDLHFNHHGFLQACKESAQIFFLGQYHAPSSPLLILCIACFALYKTIRKPEFASFVKIILGLLAFIATICLVHGFWFWSALIPLKEKISLLKSFNISRLAFLLPLLWYILLMMCLKMLWDQQKQGLVWIFVALNVLFVGGMNIELRQNVRQVMGFSTHEPNFSAFFAPKMFEEIAQFIGKDQSSYRVASVGIHPSVAQFNGFYALDAYQNNYEARYKKQFHAIIQPELTKSPKWKSYFEDWGSRCYILAHDLDQKHDPFWVTNSAAISLDLDEEAFKQMGGKYLFSTIELKNSAKFTLLKTFHQPDVPYKIYVYSTGK